ncbi:hypothetical protein C2E23DRAFT_126655 [Lenzites betulinus]|nr:hypothetical protein C2E23DRAFT_126655 [Lenzites betulinus]
MTPGVLPVELGLIFRRFMPNVPIPLSQATRRQQQAPLWMRKLLATLSEVAPSRSVPPYTREQCFCLTRRRKPKLRTPLPSRRDYQDLRDEQTQLYGISRGSHPDSPAGDGLRRLSPRSHNIRAFNLTPSCPRHPRRTLTRNAAASHPANTRNAWASIITSSTARCTLDLLKPAEPTRGRHRSCPSAAKPASATALTGLTPAGPKLPESSSRSPRCRSSEFH